MNEAKSVRIVVTKSSKDFHGSVSLMDIVSQGREFDLCLNCLIIGITFLQFTLVKLRMVVTFNPLPLLRLEPANGRR